MEVPDPGGQVDKRGIMYCAPTALDPSRGRTLCTADERFDDDPALIVTYINYEQPVAKLNIDKPLIQLKSNLNIDLIDTIRKDLTFCHSPLVLTCLCVVDVKQCLSFGA